VSKKSRGFQAGGQSPSSSSTPSSSGSAPSGSGAGRPAPSSAPTSRSAARRSSRATPGKPAPTGLAKYRTILIVGAVILGIGVLALAFYSSATAARYECESLLTAPPEPSAAAADGAPLVGFATRDMGRSHVTPNSTVRYEFCPPASGNHWVISGRAPLQRQFYRIGDDVTPGNWVHNLEHGYVVIAYRDELTAEQEAGIREVFETATQVPSAARCNVPNKVMVIPFPDISDPFALLAWDRVLLLPEWDTEQALAFANQWQENAQSPEATAC
jgi:hypothetical protein